MPLARHAASEYGLWPKLHADYVQVRRDRTLVQCLAPLLQPGSTVLDVGCGDGLISHLIREQRPDVEIFGIDVMARPGSDISGYTAGRSAYYLSGICILSHSYMHRTSARRTIITALRSRRITSDVFRELQKVCHWKALCKAAS